MGIRELAVTHWFQFLGYVPKGRFLDYLEIILQIFKSPYVTLIYKTIPIQKSSLRFISSPLHTFDNSQSKISEILFDCKYNLHFPCLPRTKRSASALYLVSPRNERGIEHFQISVMCLYVFFEKDILSHFLIKGLLFIFIFLMNSLSVLYIFVFSLLVNNLQIFSPSLCFYLFDCFFVIAWFNFVYSCFSCLSF